MDAQRSRGLVTARLTPTAGRFAIGAALLAVSIGTGTARADAAMDWNAVAASLPIPAPPIMARVMATMHGAVYDAVNSIDPRYEPYLSIPKSRSA
jgi:hypothetical protein